MEEACNKALLIKYQKEFLYWLNGGTVWRSTYHPTKGWLWVEWKTNISPNWTQPLDDTTHFVMGDKYHLLRKALAEGKIIQSNFGSMGFGCPDRWEDMSGKFGYRFEHDFECYRIKKDTLDIPATKEITWAPKKNDWVISKHSNNKTAKGKILKIHDDGAIVIEWGNGQGNCCMEASTLLPWKPQENEWIARPKYDNDNSFIVSKFRESMMPDCEPFIGVIPERYK